MKPLIPLLTLLFLTTSSYGGDNLGWGPSEPEIRKVRQCFVNGEAFLRLSEGAKVYYVMGVIDGFIGAPFGSDEKRVEVFGQCIRQRTNTQISAILEKYLRDNPDQWHIPVPYIISMALEKVCGK